MTKRYFTLLVSVIIVMAGIGIGARTGILQAQSQTVTSITSTDCAGPHCTIIATFIGWYPMLHASLSTSTHLLPQIINQLGQSGPFAAEDTLTVPIDSSGEIVGHAVAFYDSPPILFEPNGVMRGITAGLPICNWQQYALGIPLECTPVGTIDPNAPSTTPRTKLPGVGDVIGTWSDSWRAYRDDGSGNLTTLTDAVVCTSSAAGTSATCTSQNIIGTVRLELTRTIDNIKLNPPTAGWVLFNKEKNQTGPDKIAWYWSGQLENNDIQSAVIHKILRWHSFTDVFAPIPPVAPPPPGPMVSNIDVTFGSVICTDTLDNDGDSLVDCADPGCHQNDDLTLACNPNDADENQAPRAVVVAQGARLGSSVAAQGSGSSDPDGTIVSYQWTITDPNGAITTLSGANISFTGSTIGTWQVSLTVTDNDGQTNTQATTVAVFEIPIEAVITVNGNTVNQPITLNGTQSTPLTEITSYLWTVTGPSVSGLNNVDQSIANFTPLAPGTYTVTLKVMDIKGREDSSQLTLNIVGAGINPGDVEEAE